MAFVPLWMRQADLRAQADGFAMPHTAAAVEEAMAFEEVK